MTSGKEAESSHPQEAEHQIRLATDQEGDLLVCARSNKMYLYSMISKELLKTKSLPEAVLSLSFVERGERLEVLTKSCLHLLETSSLKESFQTELGRMLRQFPSQERLLDARPARRRGQDKLAEVVSVSRDQESKEVAVNLHDKKVRTLLYEVAASSPLGGRPLFDCNASGHVAMVVAKLGSLVTLREGDKRSRRTLK